jgi:LytS/YehU family sensor histidine kinase
LEIESLRFNNAFEYSIAYDKLDPAGIFIPNFLIQPFVENAIWHGLLPKEGHKKLKVSFELLSPKILSCTIDDDGVGRSAKDENKLPKNKQSLAINFTQQRLELMSKIENCHYVLIISDKLNINGSKGGTRVNITMPVTQKPM